MPRHGQVEPGRSEAFARSVLENVIGARLVVRRPPGVDFWLCRNGHVVGGLEVTIGIPQSFARLIAQLEHFGDHIDEPMLETNWQAELDETQVDLSRWDYVRFGHLVKAIEQHGTRDSHRLRDELFREELQRFGVESVYAFGGSTGGRIYLIPRGWAGAVDGSDVDALVEVLGRIFGNSGSDRIALCQRQAPCS